MPDFLPNSNVLWVVTAVFASLAIGSAIRFLMLRGAAREVSRPAMDSLISWWALAVAFIGALLLGRVASIALFTMVSIYAFYEFHRLWPPDSMEQLLRWAGYLLVGLSYLWIALGWSQVFLVFLPLAGLIVPSLLLVCAGQTDGFIRRVGCFVFALLVTAYLLAHAVLFVNLQAVSNPIGGNAGWLLFLVLITQISDISQALVGRAMGRRKLAPRVSPNKTWEGLAGGVFAAMLISVVLGPWLTPLSTLAAVAAGALIALTGFAGDMNISAIKRDAGVKDSGKLLPGQGGMLDRIDSLTFSAPAFYYFVLVVT